ncbi:MAG: putative two-component system response regulator [Thermoleophilia bacterium]|nr:putative two-component system response regulator [Thermoleophilia bacterium]
MSEHQKQIGRNEHDARASNELVSVQGERAALSGDSELAVLCECGDASCHKPLVMTVDQYEEIRAEPAQFAVLVGHEMPTAEDVVATRDGYLIVRKHGDAGVIANAGDPRNHLKTCRVVLVDDIPEIRFLLKMLLAAEPSCEVVGEASNGAEAIEVVDRTRPELVVLDLEMPVMDGWHALPHLRRVAPTSHIVVFSSAAIDGRLEKRLTNLGASRFVRKGGDPAIVIQAIREVAQAGRDRTFATAGEGGRTAGTGADVGRREGDD